MVCGSVNKKIIIMSIDEDFNPQRERERGREREDVTLLVVLTMTKTKACRGKGCEWNS